MDKRFIYLATHGETSVKGRKYFIGQVDLPLSDEGQKQAALLQNELSYVNFSSIYCSDLQRSQETATVIASRRNLDPTICSSIREINLGEWDGRCFDEINRKYPGQMNERGKNIETYRPPGGESIVNCRDRTVEAYEKMIHTTEGNLLIVGHPCANQVLLCYLLGIPLTNVCELPLPSLTFRKELPGS